MISKRWLTIISVPNLFFLVYIIMVRRNNVVKYKILEKEPDCETLFQDGIDKETLRTAENWTYGKDTLTDLELETEIRSNCERFLKTKKYILETHDEKEKEFSIAFIITTFKSANQVERLLRTVYRPWNYYCIHVDVNSDPNFFRAIDELSYCLKYTYGNIVNTRNRVKVYWGAMSLLKADLNCMKEVYERYQSWKYLINLTGQEFPLKTNKELVEILKAYGGANNIEGTYKRRNLDRIPNVTMKFPLVWYKGAIHITANRFFVKFIFESQIAKSILKALEKRSHPDEQFFATLNFNPNFRIAGSFIGDIDYHPNKIPLYYFLTRFKNWGEYSCVSKKISRGICIWGVGDLPKLVKAKHLFANKFYEDFQPATLRCLEKWYYQKVRNEEISGKANINTKYYRQMIFVTNQFQPFK